MTDRPADLPEFDQPPVVEVVMGVQFEALKLLHQGHIGLFWDKVRVAYPRTQDQARLQTPPELSDIFGWPSLRIELVDSPPVHRAWFLNEDEALLIQLQDDRLVHNWRHRGGAYPRFEPLLDLFWSHLDKLAAVLIDTGLEPLVMEQVEVSYINWIEADSMVEFFRPSTTATVNVAGVGPDPDLQRWFARYPVHGPIDLQGKLAVDVQPGRRMEDRKISSGFQFSLSFSARLSPKADRAEVLSLLGLGRAAIVKTFAALTTDTMHEQWGRTQ